MRSQTPRPTASAPHPSHPIDLPSAHNQLHTPRAIATTSHLPVSLECGGRPYQHWTLVTYNCDIRSACMYGDVAGWRLALDVLLAQDEG
ncbi:hypothetical protein EXIGLDRAFT_149885 [Exidia glandulosa HHB12029]|uniref:Uncharacterized protein n=1 Tax=Exidia glandulosa HHB12029 TaxID=1314781 RepID=A0A165FL67_EXIGL|nr:hypothetical protein EXIGLDRAFT_149885 [Exidia glandulosa HHB12029]